MIRNVPFAIVVDLRVKNSLYSYFSQSSYCFILLFCSCYSWLNEFLFQERIRRMQGVFNRERSKFKKTYESWQNQGPGAYQHCPRNDWYWEEDASFKERKSNFRAAPRGSRPSGQYMWSHHYAVLGLDRYDFRASLFIYLFVVWMTSEELGKMICHAFISFYK